MAVTDPSRTCTRAGQAKHLEALLAGHRCSTPLSEYPRESDVFGQRTQCFRVFRRSEAWARETSVQNHVQNFDRHELGVCRLDPFQFLPHLQIISNFFYFGGIALLFRLRVRSLGSQIPIIFRHQGRFH